MKKSVSQWLQHMERLHHVPIAMGLERVAKVKERLALQHRPFIFTVAGTNGKGSTCAFLERLCRDCGLSTGLYTSPHLLRFQERICVNGTTATDEILQLAFERVEEARVDISLTYFEFGTLAAWCVFEVFRPDVVVQEVGLGGRLDAVNVFDADCALITSIALDHMNFLGNTRNSIAREKAGIMRSTKPVVIAEPDPPSSLFDEIGRIGARAMFFGRDYGVEAVSDTSWQWWALNPRRHFVLPLPALRGVHQLRNAASALMALDSASEQLTSRFSIAPLVNIERAGLSLQKTNCSGRFQTISSIPSIIVDVAHNPEAAASLAENLRNLPISGRTWAIFGMMSDKDGGVMVEHLQDLVDGWLPVTLPGPRGERGETLVQLLRKKNCLVKGCFDEPAQALIYARACAKGNDRILVFGSFITVAAVLTHIFSHEQQPSTSRY